MSCRKINKQNNNFCEPNVQKNVQFSNDEI